MSARKRRNSMARHRKKDPAALVCNLAVVFAVTAATCLLDVYKRPL